MPRNGTGAYTPPPGTAAVANTTIESDKYNDFLDDNAAAHSAAIVADGQKPFVANQPMGGNKFTGLAAGSANGDSVRYEQSPVGILTTRGDTLRRGASAPERVALGTAGQFFKSDGTDATWKTVTGADIIDDGLGNLTKNMVVVAPVDNFTFVAADRGKLYRAAAASKTWTLAAASSGLAGWNVEIDDASGGTIIASPGTDLYINGASAAASYTFSKGEWGTLKCIGASGYVLNTSGALASTSKAGVVPKATQAQTNAGTADKYPSAAEIKGMMFESAEISLTKGDTATVAHGLGVKPKRVEPYIRCKTAEGGYSAGEELLMNWVVASGSTNANGISASIVDSTNLRYVVGNDVSIYIPKVAATTGNYFTITNANWKLVLRAWAY